MSNHPFIKANYPHHEGIWGWGNAADQVVLMIRSIRRSMVECECIQINHYFYILFLHRDNDTNDFFQTHSFADHDILWDIGCKLIYFLICGMTSLFLI